MSKFESVPLGVKSPADDAIAFFIKEVCATYSDESQDIPIIRALVRFQEAGLPHNGDSQEQEFLYRLTALLESRLNR
jgi:hypothetical protein